MDCEISVGLLDHTHDVFFTHHEVLGALDLDGLTGIFAEEDLVALLHVQRTHFAVFQQLAGANGNDFAAIGLLGRRIGNDDARGGLPLLFEALDDDSIVQGGGFS